MSDAQAADTATFYSISSTQKGLAGVDLGNFLIKQVAHKVLAEFPGVQNLVTLSPIPGFRAWLDTQVRAELNRNETVCSLAIVMFFSDAKPEHQTMWRLTLWLQLCMLC